MRPTSFEPSSGDVTQTVAEATRRTMQANKGRDTGPERAVRSALHATGLRFRVCSPLPFDRRRRADILFPRAGLYVFIDGCFWHGCPQHFVMPKTNTDFWAAKIEGNRQRDDDSTTRLQDAGYTVLRFWEHEAPTSVAAVIAGTYRSLIAP